MQCRILSACIIVCLSTLTGCGPYINGIATQSGAAAGAAAGKTAPPAAIDKLVEMDTPANRDRIAGIVRSSTAQDASRMLGNGVGRGLIDEIVAIANVATTSTTADTQLTAATEPADARPTTHPTSRPVLKLGNINLQNVMTNQIDPIVGEIARTFVYEGIKAATGPEAQNGARAITRATSDGAMQGAIDALKEHGPALKEVIVGQFGPAIGEALRQQITPWVQELRKQNFRGDIHAVLQEDLAPTARQLWDQATKDTLLIPTQPDIAPAVVTNSSNVSKGAGVATHDAMVDLGVLRPSGGLTTQIKLLITGVIFVGVLIGVAAAASIILLSMQIVRTWRSSPRAG